MDPAGKQASVAQRGSYAQIEPKSKFLRRLDPSAAASSKDCDSSGRRFGYGAALHVRGDRPIPIRPAGSPSGTWRPIDGRSCRRPASTGDRRGRALPAEAPQWGSRVDGHPLVYRWPGQSSLVSLPARSRSRDSVYWSPPSCIQRNQEASRPTKDQGRQIEPAITSSLKLHGALPVEHADQLQSPPAFTFTKNFTKAVHKSPNQKSSSGRSAATLLRSLPVSASQTWQGLNSARIHFTNSTRCRRPSGSTAWLIESQ